MSHPAAWRGCAKSGARRSRWSSSISPSSRTRPSGENVAYGLKMKGAGKQERREAAIEALSKVGLQDHADSLPSELSGGMQQRVGLARGLATNPQILLMDETVRCARPADPARDAGRTDRSSEGTEEDHHLHHPRPQRGAASGRPHRHHEGRLLRAGRHRPGHRLPAGGRLRARLRRRYRQEPGLHRLRYRAGSPQDLAEGHGGGRVEGDDPSTTSTRFTSSWTELRPATSPARMRTTPLREHPSPSS